MKNHSNGILEKEYELRFDKVTEYRNNVWKILVKRFFQPLISTQATVLDLGSGYGEFINNINAVKKYAMDLNQRAGNYCNHNVKFIHQDCAAPWDIPRNSLDVVFSSNFLEHLQSKAQIQKVIEQAHNSLKQDGLLILLGPNIKYVGEQYWDFWDHQIPITEASLCELLKIYNFKITECIAKFLPYSMSNTKTVPLFLIAIYLKFPFFWEIMGKQFLVVAKKSYE